jgi:TorA maturation chaperone TorD
MKAVQTTMDNHGDALAPTFNASETASAANALARLFGDAGSLERAEADLIVGGLSRVAPEEFAAYQNAPHRFAQQWDEDKDLFMPPTARLSLEESVYKPWTSDPSHPLHGAKGLAWGDSAEHMATVLEGMGMQPDPNRTHAPDHLAVLLEFLAVLLDQGRVREATAFCTDHFDWLDELQAQAEEKEVSGLLAGLIRTTRRLVVSITTEATTDRNTGEINE